MRRNIQEEHPMNRALEKALAYSFLTHDKNAQVVRKEASPQHRFTRQETIRNDEGTNHFHVRREYVTPVTIKTKHPDEHGNHNIVAVANFDKREGEEGYYPIELIKVGEAKWGFDSSTQVMFYTDTVNIQIVQGLLMLDVSYQNNRLDSLQFGAESVEHKRVAANEGGIWDQQYRQLQEKGKIAVDEGKTYIEALYDRRLGIYTIRRFFAGELKDFIVLPQVIDDEEIREKLFPEKYYYEDPYDGPSFYEDVNYWLEVNIPDTYKIVWDSLGIPPQTRRQI